LQVRTSSWKFLGKRHEILNRTLQLHIGLRGAIAFALALDVPKSLPGATAIFTTTLMIIFFTVLVQGGVTITVLKKLNIPMNVDQEVHTSSEGMKDYRKERNLFLDFDRKYLRAFFAKNPRAAYHIQEDEDANMNHMELTSISEKEEELVMEDLGSEKNGNESDEN
jgi:NhaP-type Na+/H+ or K+/H+ antiporter